VCVCVCVSAQQGEMQAAAVLSLLAQILADLFIAPPAFSAIPLSLLSSICRITGLDSPFKSIGPPQRRQGKSSLSRSGEEDADFLVSEVRSGEQLLPCFPHSVAQKSRRVL